MAQPSKKRPFVPTDRDRRRALELRRRPEAKGLRQPVVAGLLGIKTRTLQRYMDLERAIPVRVIELFEEHFGKLDSPSVEAPQPQPSDGVDDAALERVLARHEVQLTYAQVKHVRRMQTLGLTLSEQQWEHLVSAILTGRQPSP